MDVLANVRDILRDTLQIGDRADGMTESSPLLGQIPELDSMAVVSVIAQLEEHFGISVHDDEISAETFATLGSLAAYVESKR